MKNVSFIKTPEEIAFFQDGGGEKGFDLLDIDALFMVWETNPEVVKKLVPAPLEPLAPIAFSYIANMGGCSHWKNYNEGALYIPVKHDGGVSFYCLAMAIGGKNDTAIALGREVFGYPKKNASELAVVRTGNHVHAWIERHGIRYIDVEAEIGEYNTPEAANILGAFKTGAEVPGNVANFHYGIESIGDKASFTNVKLVDSLCKFKFSSVENAKINNITLKPSADDPWAEVEVVRPLGAAYVRCDISMFDTKLIAEVDPQEAAPYLFSRWDASTLGHTYRSFVNNGKADL